MGNSEYTNSFIEEQVYVTSFKFLVFSFFASEQCKTGKPIPGNVLLNTVASFILYV